MNTREINGSAWQLEYYFITAIPLAFLTALLPLIVPAVFSFLRRHPTATAHLNLQRTLHWPMVITTLVLNLWSDIRWFIVDPTSPLSSVITGAKIILLRLLARSIDFGILARLRQLRSSKSESGPDLLLPLKKEILVRILLLLFATGSFLASTLAYPFLELPTYFIYFFLVWRKYWKQKQNELKESSPL
jgi:hypothetical protein